MQCNWNRPLPSAKHQPGRKIMQRKTHPSFSFHSFVGYPPVRPTPLIFPRSFLLSPSSIWSSPLDTVVAPKIKIMVPATPMALFYLFDRFFFPLLHLRRNNDSRHANRATGFLSPFLRETKKNVRGEVRHNFIVWVYAGRFVKGAISK